MWSENAPEMTSEGLNAQKNPWGGMPPDPPRQLVCRGHQPYIAPPKFSTFNFYPPLTIFLNESLHVCMHICTYIRTYVCTYVVRMYVCMSYVCTCMYVRMSYVHVCRAMQCIHTSCRALRSLIPSSRNALLECFAWFPTPKISTSAHVLLHIYNAVVTVHKQTCGVTPSD